MRMYRDLTTLYVSPTGTGNGKYPSCTGNGPLGSLKQAFRLIDQMRGGGMLQPVTVSLLPGEYDLSEPVLIGPTGSNVTVAPYGNGEVLISGGKRITGFRRAEFNGAACFAAFIPEVKDGSWKFTDLYVDGLRAEKPRLPETGYYHMADTEVPDGELFSSSRRFRAELQDAELFSKLHAFEDTFVSFNHYWIDEHTPVKSLDCDTGWVTMEYKSRFLVKPGQEYIVENTAETFGKPNQWYLDRAEGMLYYVPRDASQTPENIAVYAPVASELVRITGRPGDPVTGVRFKDVTFAYTRGDYGSVVGTHGESESVFSASDSQSVSNAHGSLTVAYAHNVSFSGCTLRNYGVHGVNIKEGCRSVRVEGCRLYDGGAGGVRICGGDWQSPEADRTIGCAVTDCSITHVGRRYFSGCGVLVMHAAETDILHNEIGDLFYTGISCGWIWGYSRSVCRDNRIMKNHIHDLGQGFLSDMGGVYLLGSQPGTVVSGNVIHDIKCKDYGGWALYTDEGSAGILLENNICYATSSNSYHQHYGSSNVVRNNVFADADAPLLAVSRPEAHLSILFTGNILYSKGTPMRQDFSQIADGDYPLYEGSVVTEGNLFFDHSGTMTYSTADDVKTLNDAKAHGMEEESVEADPLFRDPAAHDYALLPGSPAFGIGFTPIDASNVGPRA